MVIKMESILNSAWAQGGAIGLLVVSGWILWWLERRERMQLQSKHEVFLEALFTFMNDQRDTLKDMAEKLALQEVLKDEFEKLRNK
jgi:hypothetical protein